MGLSLKYIFAIVTFCSIVAWCAAQAGFDNRLFWCAAGASVPVSVAFVYLTRNPHLLRSALLVYFVLMLCMVPMFPLTLLVNALLLVAAGIFCSYRPPLRTTTLWAIAMVSASLSLIAGVLPGTLAVCRLVAMRQEFPIVSLEDRLQYEQPLEPPAKVALNTDVANRLRELEKHLNRGRYKRHQFARIHDRQYETSVRAVGFGTGFMIMIGLMPVRPMPIVVRQPPLRNIPFAATPYVEVERDRRDWSVIAQLGRSDNVEHVHAISRADFLDNEYFGMPMPPNRRVAGFVEHAFHDSPLRGLEDPKEWTIVRLELVSLLKFGEPRVYMLDHLPRMDQLANDDVSTRPLDEFESRALQQLWTDKDLVISHEESHYRMLGSLRAANQCLDCHAVHRGTLLGAFTYELRYADRE